MSNRYPELTMMTGAGETASRDSRTVVFWAAAVELALPARIAAPLRGRQDVAAVEATPERNCLRESSLESDMVCLFLVTVHGR
jgi:hypothetical protein